MMSRNIIRKVLPRTLTRSFASEASADASSVTLNFSVPYESIYNGASVFQVIIPGVEGEYGVTPNHVPYVAQMKPGVLQILHEEGNLSESEKYFVAGGYALTHENSVTVRNLKRGKMCDSTLQPAREPFLTHIISFPLQDIVAPEAVKLDEIDPSAVQSQFDAAKGAFASAAAGSVEQAEAQIDMEVNRAMGMAVGLTLA